MRHSPRGFSVKKSHTSHNLVCFTATVKMV
jgi:hypothetical protein